MNADPDPQPGGLSTWMLIKQRSLLLWMVDLMNIYFLRHHIEHRKNSRAID